MSDAEGVIGSKDILLGLIITATVALVVVILYDVVKDSNTTKQLENKE